MRNAREERLNAPTMIRVENEMISDDVDVNEKELLILFGEETEKR